MVTTHDVVLFETYDLQNYCDDNYGSSWRAANRAKTWIEGAFDQTSDYDVTVSIATDSAPNPPQEGPARDDFTTSCLCHWQYNCTYNNLWVWWVDWLNNSDCKDPHDDANDCRMLLTNYDSSGLGSSKTAVACIGQKVAELSSAYSRFGNQPRHNGMDTVLEELGHCLINWDSSNNNCDHKDDDGDGRSHDSGAVLYDSTADDYGITPMGLAGDRCHNNCSDDSLLDTPYCFSRCDDDGDGEPDGWVLEYSDCTKCGFVE